LIPKAFGVERQLESVKRVCYVCSRVMLPSFITAILWSLSVVCANQSARLVGSVAANLSRLCLAGVLLALWANIFGRGLGGGAHRHRIGAYDGQNCDPNRREQNLTPAQHFGKYVTRASISRPA
jgi:hypothetical protein